MTVYDWLTICGTVACCLLGTGVATWSLWKTHKKRKYNKEVEKFRNSIIKIVEGKTDESNG